MQLTVFLQALGYLFQLVSFFLFAKLLGSDNQGILSIFRATGQIIASLIWFGLPGGIIYFVGKDRNLFYPVIRNCLRISLIVFPLLILILCTFPMDKFPKIFLLGDYIPYLIIFIIFLSYLAIFETSILSIQKYTYYNLFTFGAGVIIFVFAIVIWFMPYGYNKLNLAMLAYLATYGLMFMYGAILVSNEKNKINARGIKQSFWEQFKVGFRGFISSIASLLLFRLDLFLVGYFLSVKEVGIYSIALFSIEFFTKIPAWSAAVLTPMVASNERNHIKRTVYLFYSAIIITLLLGLFLILLLVTFPNIISHLIGKDFTGVETCMLLLLPRVIMQSGVVILAANLAGKGYPWYHPIGCTIPLVMLVLLDIYLIPILGINGAALGNSLAYISAAIIFWLGFIKYNDHNENISLKTYWYEVRGYLHVRLSV